VSIKLDEGYTTHRILYSVFSDMQRYLDVHVGQVIHIDFITEADAEVCDTFGGI